MTAESDCRISIQIQHEAFDVGLQTRLLRAGADGQPDRRVGAVASGRPGGDGGVLAAATRRRLTGYGCDVVELASAASMSPDRFFTSAATSAGGLDDRH